MPTIDSPEPAADVAGAAAVAEKPADAAPAPQFVPVEEFKRLEAMLAGQQELLSTLNETVRAVGSMARGAGGAPASAPADVTEEQFIRAIEDRDVATVKRYNEQQGAKLVATHVEPLRRLGVDAIGDLTRAGAAAQMPYYTRWKKEIDGLLANLPPAARLAPDAYRIAHDAIVGSHTAELIAEAKAQALRAPEPDPVPTGPVGRRAAGGGGKTPNAEELFGEDARLALRSKGMDEEAFAKKLGYASWSDYVKLAQAEA